ncbi:MAG: T9SS type A sorting domain-containing protein, partial [Flavobacteriales bacterium]|nr:T9SS type A sorting domain-containing protein [Flavobacteriales bacterium]
IDDSQLPEFSFSLFGIKFQDDPDEFLIGEPEYLILDSLGNPADPDNLSIGTYAVQVSGLTQTEPENYELIFETGVLIVEPAPIYVVAEMACMTQWDSLPEFSYLIEGYDGDLADILIADPVFLLSDLSGQEFYPANFQWNIGLVPGAYVLMPDSIVLDLESDREIVYVPSVLYVNPRGPSANDIDVWVECISPLLFPINGFSYQVEFGYQNNNPITLCIPPGEDNSLSGDGDYEIELPTLYEPGINYFSGLFDNTALTWTLKSYEDFTLNVNTAYAGPEVVSCITIIQLKDGEELESIIDLFPNPTTGQTSLVLGEEISQVSEITVLDMMGIEQVIPINFDRKSRRIDLELNGLNTGVYFIQVSTDRGTLTKRVFKE